MNQFTDDINVLFFLMIRAVIVLYILLPIQLQALS